MRPWYDMTHNTRIKGTHLYSVPACAIWNEIPKPMYIHKSLWIQKWGSLNENPLYFPLEQKLQNSDVKQNAWVKAPTSGISLFCFVLLTYSFFNELTTSLVDPSSALYHKTKTKPTNQPTKTTRAFFMALWQCFQILNAKEAKWRGWQTMRDVRKAA